MKKYTLLFLAIVIVGVGFYASPQIFSKKTVSPAIAVATTAIATTSSTPTKVVTPNFQPIVAKTTHAPNVTILIASTSYPIFAPAGTNVMDAMRIFASSTGIQFTGHQYSGLGMFIDSINGKENSNGYYWFLYMNGKSSELGASQTILKDGDIIEWRYEKNY